MSGHQSFATALLDPQQPVPCGLTTGNGTDVAARFAIYRNNVIASLIDALADTFPVTRALVGDDFFRSMARVFVARYPPRTPVLAWYGDAFPAFVAGFRAAASLPYLADLARLEWAYVQAFHADDQPPLSVDTIAMLLAESADFSGLRLIFHPTVGVLNSSYAIFSLWAAHQSLPVDLSGLDLTRPEAVLLVRPELEVEVIRLGSAAAELIGRLHSGHTLAASVQETIIEHPDLDLPNVLGLLIRARCLTELSLNGD